MAIKGVIFDMDGTITECNVDFEAIKREARVPDVPILEYMEEVDEPRRKEILQILEKYEAQAAKTTCLRKGVEQVLEGLKRMGVKTALLTRNSRRSVKTILGRYKLSFDTVVTRNDAPPKPSPYPVLLIARRLGLRPEELLIVGDFHFDIQAGRAAGANTALITSEGNPAPTHQKADFLLSNPSQLLDILKEGHA